MPRLKENQLPSYRLHKQSGQAIVTLAGKDFLLGKYGSSESREAYKRKTAEYITSGRRAPASPRAPMTVTEVVGAYWKHVKVYYRKDGKPTSEQTVVKGVEAFTQPVRQHAGGSVWSVGTQGRPAVNGRLEALPSHN